MAYTADDVQVIVSGRCPSGDVWQNTWAARRLDPGGTSAGLAGVFETGYGDLLATAGFHEDTDATRIVIRHLIDGAFEDFVIAESGVTSGRATNNQLACVVTLETGTAGRRGRGRIYLPPLAETTLDTPIPTLGISGRESIVDAIEAMYDAAIVAEWNLGVNSRVDEEVRDLVAIRVGSVLDTQRRRRSDLEETFTSRTL